MIWRLGPISVLCFALSTAAIANEPFRFESIVELDEMRSLMRGEFSGSSTRDQVRARFVEQGDATLILHPKRANVEKYIYDINLCSYYVWRWSISADYTADGRLKQLYLNGEPTLGDAKPMTAPSRGALHQLVRDRPEAFKGESSLAALISDGDRNLKTRHDQWLIMGVGPTRADPLNMGKAHAYKGEVWRSIFDLDPARAIVPYQGDCAAADARVQQLTTRAATSPEGETPAPSGTSAPPPPEALDDIGVRAWLTDHIDTDGWTLIAADGAAVVLGSPKGVSRSIDGLLSSEIRHEYYRPVRFGDFDGRSNLQTWDVDCRALRIRIRSMVVFAGNNMSGASIRRNWQDADWSAAGANEARARTVDRICQAPTTGQRLN